jgi:hypothetical protein
MSSRAVRKALKRREAQKQLESEILNDDKLETDEEEEDVKITAPTNPFAMA